MDEDLILHIAGQVGAILKRLQMMESLQESERKVNALLDIVKVITGIVIIL